MVLVGGHMGSCGRRERRERKVSLYSFTSSRRRLFDVVGPHCAHDYFMLHFSQSQTRLYWYGNDRRRCLLTLTNNQIKGILLLLLLSLSLSPSSSLDINIER